MISGTRRAGGEGEVNFFFVLSLQRFTGRKVLVLAGGWMQESSVNGGGIRVADEFLLRLR